MPTLTVTSETMRLSDELGYWVRPTLLAGGVGGCIINLGYAGDRSNGSVITIWQRPISASQANNQPGSAQVVATILPTDGVAAGPNAADPNFEYDAGCDTGDLVAGDTPIVTLGA